MKLEVTLNKEQFDLLLTSLVQIAQGCVRMAKSWEGDPVPPKETPVEEVTEKKEEEVPQRRHYRPRKNGDVGARTIMKRVGLPNDSSKFRAACESVRVKYFTHREGDFHLFIKQTDEETVTNELKRIFL